MGHDFDGQLDGDVRFRAHSAFMMADAMIRTLMNQLE